MWPVTNPRPLVGLLDRERTRTVQPVLLTPTQVVRADPDRSYFVVFAEIPAIGTFVISPDPGVQYGVSPVGQEQHVVISSDRYPLLCQQEWWITTPTPGASPIYVIEVRRTSGG